MIVGKSCISWGALCLAMLVVGAGCNQDEGPPRYELTGRATFGGEPIPCGSVQFAPDTSRGNRGPGSVGDINDGVYRTRQQKGILGGAYVVTIDGHLNDAKNTPLFEPFVIEASLPENGGDFDFDVPASAPKPRRKVGSSNAE